MRKFLLLIFVSFITFSCKKEFVDPIVVNNSVNRLPKKIVKRDAYFGVKVVKTYNFRYNENNMLSEVIRRDSLCPDSTKTLFVYENGLLKTKTYYSNLTQIYSRNYNYENNKLTSIESDVPAYDQLGPRGELIPFVYDDIYDVYYSDSSLLHGQKVKMKIKYVYDELNDVKYMIHSVGEFWNDSIVFFNNYTSQNGNMKNGFTKVRKYNKNRIFTDSITTNVNSNNNFATLNYWKFFDYFQNFSNDYIFLDKQIMFQNELSDYILLYKRTELATKEINNNYFQNKYCIKFGYDEFEYFFDAKDRLEKIKNKNIDTPFTTYIYY